MDSDSTEMVKEIKDKVILHWNCRGLVEFPEEIRIYGSHIQEIYLKWNKLTTLPPWIVELVNVTNLYVYENFIKEIPLELCQMNQLTVLDLSANKLEQISPCIRNLVSLKCLFLNQNLINKLPIEMNQMLNLEILSICGNRFVALPEWIGSLPKLKELNADNNYLKELPNRLTLSPQLSIISVRSNRLRYLPLNGFVSSPCIRFDANVHLNYLSYPLLYQLTSQVLHSYVQTQRNILNHGCFTKYRDNTTLYTNIKLKIKINALHEKDTDPIIELPRQLLKVHNVHENKVISLWELALRKVYTERYKHTLNISVSPISINVQYEPLTIKNYQKLDFNVSCNLLMNGPVSICVNFQCQQPIFTETWIIIGVDYYTESITTVALCCCRRCAAEFSKQCNMIIKHTWNCIN
ncbi:PREDICTED: leucine-rich repeat-containing protein 28-like [Eufriesea mexicana]|uniref:leucine-rich repeat-containing protein 28-like n=1 Tax=Eufriesea mexicana TaxID=516756 RepID=UPI00083C582B|nr:PREDICTED: leucine-rich repeat-containing protein 28-like [Eufriesea mexicana]